MANPQLEDGYTTIANEIMDALIRTNFPAHERRVLDCILRKTYGFHKKTDRISYTQFEEATGIDRRHIFRSIHSLIKRHIVICTGSGYMLEYGLQKNHELWDNIDTISGNKLTPSQATNTQKKSLPQMDKLTPSQVRIDTISGNEIDTISGNHKNNKYILQKHITKTIGENTEILEYIKRDTWLAFLEMRKVIKAPMTERAVTLLISEIKKLKEIGQDPEACTNQSILNNWKSVYAIKERYGRMDGKNAQANTGREGGQEGRGQETWRVRRPQDFTPPPEQRNRPTGSETVAAGDSTAGGTDNPRAEIRKD